jgi:hypothetical protein
MGRAGEMDPAIENPAVFREQNPVELRISQVFAYIISKRGGEQSQISDEVLPGETDDR